MDVVVTLVHRIDSVVTLVQRLVFGHDDDQDLMEYGLLVALIAIIAIVVVSSVGNTVNSMFWETFTSAIASAA